MINKETFDAMQVSLASPHKIRSWSRGAVTKPETINYRTLKPEKEGLFCEKIFGPSKDWECNCGKYKRFRYEGVICDKCGVEVTKSKVRRERMGHIELAAPVSHIWYFRGIPSKLGIFLDLSPKELEKVLYFANYIVTDSGETSIPYKEIITEEEYREYIEKYGNKAFEVGMGAEAVKKLIEKIDLGKEIEDLRSEVETASGHKKHKIVRRLEVLESFANSENNPAWMILDVVPVMPPDLRPMVQLDGGRFATSDLNDLYRRVINRNNRLNKLLEMGSPEIIVRNEKRMLQEAVDSLIDNGRRGKPVTGASNRALKSLSDMLKGKQGRFRQNLLGKRVDYSGRSVIVVGPELKFYQCGLPKKMALELFKPFVMRELVKNGLAHNIKTAKNKVERVDVEVWDILEEVIQNHPVLLNRAPTLHRLGIQAFEPVLVEGKAIKLHPLVCAAYNADFDGDQMAVHLPLTLEAQAEARFLMLSINNILAPKDGHPITSPSKDMVLGTYYMTLEEGKTNGTGMIFSDYDEMIIAHESGQVGLHARVRVRVTSEDGVSKLVESTVGRFIFNKHIPQDLGFVDRSIDKFSLEIDKVADKKVIAKIVTNSFKVHGYAETAVILDVIKDLGVHYSTIGAISIAISDMEVPGSKQGYIDEAKKEVDKRTISFKRGFISDQERKQSVIKIWNETTEKISKDLMKSLNITNNVHMMYASGARGSESQIRQLAGMRGLMSNATGETVEVPILSNFREGLSVLEYFISTTGARKGSADMALRTADSGYLTRRLVDVAQDIIITEIDCKTTEGIRVYSFKDGMEVIEPLEERIGGRYLSKDIVKNKKTIAKANDLIDDDVINLIKKNDIEEIYVRSSLTCDTKQGICSKCYGLNLANNKLVNVGEAVGIIAAQSIGEPGTQLTMRTFHTGGVANASDITQGLPRVEELFESRTPKWLAIISEIDGVATIEENSNVDVYTVVVTGEEVIKYTIPFDSKLKIKNNQQIKAGDLLTEGSINPKLLLEVKGIEAVQDYIIKEIQRTYKMNGVDINDKHIEIIIKQMLNKVKITSSGDTGYLPNKVMNLNEIVKTNKKMIEDGKEPAEYERLIQGITKASLATDSFLSASSFQETTRVLTDAAVKGKIDNLVGLKENVIIGKLIPAGTGLAKYKNVEIEGGIMPEVIEAEETEEDIFSEKVTINEEDISNYKFIELAANEDEDGNISVDKFSFELEEEDDDNNEDDDNIEFAEEDEDEVNKFFTKILLDEDE